MRYKAILLDFYGTLVREDDAVIDRIVRRIAAVSPVCSDPGQIGRSWRFAELCRDSYKESFRPQRALELESLESLLREYRAPLDARELSEELFAYWRRPAACPEAGEFLTGLTVPTCVVSNIDTADLEAAIAHRGWRFDAVVTSEQCRAYKPRPEPFLAALEALGLGAHDVLHVGDSLFIDVHGAQGLGIDVAWVNRKNRPLPAGIAEPTFTVAHVGELTGMLA